MVTFSMSAICARVSFRPKAELRAARALAKILAKITKVTKVIDLGKLKPTKVIKVYRQAQKL